MHSAPIRFQKPTRRVEIMPCLPRLKVGTCEEEGVSDEKWEYKMHTLAFARDERFYVSQLLIELEDSGNSGWELCGIDEGVYIFKRRKRE